MNKAILLAMCYGFLIASQAEGFQQIELEDTQKLTSPLNSPEEARQMISLPDGFQASVFAAEPDIRQPIAVTTDARGRIWVAECITYAESGRNFDTRYNDRILIFEDTNGDGVANSRKVFWSGGKRLTSLEVGHGGVWVTCAPHFMFIPDRDGDDIPDGKPEILLDGWDDDFVRHNMVNGLRWGPDGWLYGRHGIQATSHVGPPGATDSQRVALNCCIWRFHPRSRDFEVVCEGTTNPWGHDWDEHGELFMINTVIGHLWHVVPGARYRRMYGSHFNPYTYEVIEQTADHFHFESSEDWNHVRDHGISEATDQLGGGHAHCGLMIYQGDNWPDEYRGDLFTANFHGLRLNRESVEREGNGYVGRHRPDFMFTRDLWFRGVEMIYGPDGGVFLLDWSDIGECHENDGIHRTSGRIYKITFGKTEPVDCKLQGKSVEELFGFLDHRNQWFVRTASRLLQERANEQESWRKINNLLDARLQTGVRGELEEKALLQIMWLKHAINYPDRKPDGGVSVEMEGEKPVQTADNFRQDVKNDHLWSQLLKHDSEHVRAWSVRLWTDLPATSCSGIQMEKMLDAAETDPSGLVRLYLASAMRRMNGKQRVRMASTLANWSSDADDRTQPKLIWFGLEPAVVEYWQQAIELASLSRIPYLRRCVVRRLAAEAESRPEFLTAMLKWASENPEQTGEVLDAMVESLAGRRRVATPDNWDAVSGQLTAVDNADNAEIRNSLAFLGAIFGEGASIADVRAIATNTQLDTSVRRQAIKALAEARPDDLFETLNKMLRDRAVAVQVVRAMAFCTEPKVAGSILGSIRTFDPETERAAIATLCARKPWAESLLMAMADGRVSKTQVTAAHVRQIRTHQDPELNLLLSRHWGAINETSAERAETMERIRQLIERKDIAPDMANGAKMFQQSCISCHVLFGTGGKRGPDLTGSDRRNLPYLLENIIDPGATVADTYRSSILQMVDGRLLVGVVTEETEQTLRLLMVEDELVIEVDQIEERRDTGKSLMPDGILDKLTDQEIVDLFGYLRKE